MSVVSTDEPQTTRDEVVERIRHDNRPDTAAGVAVLAAMDQTRESPGTAAIRAGAAGESRPEALSSDELLDLLVDQPSTGRMRALNQKLNRSGRSPQAPLLNWLANEQPPEPPVAPDRYVNPMLAVPDGPRQPLTSEQLAFLERFRGATASMVSAEDAAELARLEQVAESGAGQRLVAEVVAPIRRHHDRREEEAELRAELDRLRPSSWRSRRDNLPVLAGWVGDVMADEAETALREYLVPGTPPEIAAELVAGCRTAALSSAHQRLAEIWDAAEADLAAQRSTLEERLLHLAWGGDPKSSAGRQTSAATARRQRRAMPTPGQLRDQLFSQFGHKSPAA